MAVVIASPAQTTPRRTFTEPTFPGTSAFTSQMETLGSVPSKFYAAKNVSTASIISCASLPPARSYRSCENIQPRNTSQTTLDNVHQYVRSTKGSGIRKVSGHSSLQTVICTRADTPEIRIPSPDRPATQDSCSTQIFVTPFDTPERCTSVKPIIVSKELEVATVEPPKLRLCSEGTSSEVDVILLEASTQAQAHQAPLRRWISTLRRKRRKQPLTIEIHNQHRRQIFDQEIDGGRGGNYHMHSPSFNSSLDLLGETRTASVGIDSSSIALNSPYSDMLVIMRRPNRRSGCSDQRTSMDSSIHAAQMVVDEEVRERFYKRQHILQELLSSEESYVSDLKTLSTTYFTFLAGGSHLVGRNRVHRAINQIHQLHRELLADIQQIITHDQPRAFDGLQKLGRRRKWFSSESSPPHSSPLRGTFVALRSSLDTNRPVLTRHVFGSLVAPELVQTAKLFDQYMPRFFAYEAFLSNIEIMQADADANFRAIPHWTSQERGVEALAKALLPAALHEDYSRKGLTFDDLLIKPVQRICKYALFFADLCRHTPCCDDPVAHEWFERIRTRLDDTAAELDKATDNPLTRQCIEMSWRLEDRLVFPSNPSLTKVVICRRLGHVALCGVLHVAYSALQNHVRGHFSIAVLYRSKLLLASASKDFNQYIVDAIIPLTFAAIEEVDNGRGIQCHTVPFSWKLGFEHHRQRYEILFSACSRVEEDVWRTTTQNCIAAEVSRQSGDHPIDTDKLDHIPRDCRALNSVWRHQHPAGLQALQRSATVGPRSSPQHILIRNTTASRVGNTTRDELPVVRSQSHLSPNNLPVLAPRRAERMRLEACLHDVWSRELLPYPGMPIKKLDNPIRASAQSVMRKFSMTSLASNFSRRSASQASLKPRRRQDDSCTASTRSVASTIATSVSGGHPTVGNVHQVILPDDFDQPLKQDVKHDQYAVIPSIVKKTRSSQRPMANKLQKRSCSEGRQTLTRSARASLAIQRPSVQSAVGIAHQEPDAMPHGIEKPIAFVPTKAPIEREHQKRRRAGGRLMSLARFWI